MSSLGHLVYMANQIARNFGTLDDAAAADAVADHIASFWDPRMRQMILDHLGAGGEGLSSVAKAAIETLRQKQPA
jgi:formate dehydrogenase subunit delta